jgi:glycerol kinase
MEQDLGKPINTLRVDGGMSQNNLLMQLQSDSLGQNVERGKVTETTALGAAYLAGLGAGIFSNLQSLGGIWELDRKFTSEEKSTLSSDSWHQAVKASENY